MSNHQDISQQKFLIYTSAASIIASLIAKVFCHPIDTIKTKLQIQTMSLTGQDIKNQRFILKVIQDTIKKEGFKGFYQGYGIASLGLVPASCLYFTSYEYSKILLNGYSYLQSHPSLLFFTAGMMAEVVSCLFWLPIDVIKERQQANQNLGFNYKNALDAFRQILNNEGIIGLYRAYGATLASFGPFSAFYFLFYEELKKNVCQDINNISFKQSLFLSATAGSVASFITNPLDMAKLRMQVQRGEKAINKDGEYKSRFGNKNMFHGIYQIFKNEGFLSLITKPLDIAKLRMQEDQRGEKAINKDGEYKSRFGYKNMFHGIYLIYKNEGFLSLWKGSLARILYHAPTTAICMSLMESFRSSLINQFEKKH